MEGVVASAQWKGTTRVDTGVGFRVVSIRLFEKHVDQVTPQAAGVQSYFLRIQTRIQLLGLPKTLQQKPLNRLLLRQV